MKVTNKIVYEKLDELYHQASVSELTDKSKYVIFSDLHMGDGGSTDDFRPNANLFQTVLRSYYLNHKFSLMLNGDVEELQRFSAERIFNQWQKVYKLFQQFQEETSIVKTIGNHDLKLSVMKQLPFDYTPVDSFRLQYKGENIFFFHGHQASKKFQKHNKLIGFTLKYFANPLRIKNYSVAHSSTKQYKIEKRAYHYSAYRKVISIIGHTHRPLFESFHKVERLKFKIEQLCRDYARNPSDGSEEVSKTIKNLKKDLKKHYAANKDTNYKNYVYNTMFHIPCLFNSGCVIGKRGMTCLEISEGKIRLVHWFDSNISEKYLRKTGYEPEPIPGTDFYRMVVNEESLDYIFTRIKFLA